MKHDINTDKLADYLSGVMSDFQGPITAFSKVPGGQSNPTFKFKAGGMAYVLRAKPLGQLLKSAHAVDREFKVQSALSTAPVPVARMHHLCEDEAIIGSMFYIMDFVEGRSFLDPQLQGLAPSDRGEIIDTMGQVLANLHAVDLEAVGLEDFGPTGSYFERQTARWTKQYQASKLIEIQAMDDLAKALVDEIPDDDGQRSLVHGDYRIDNLLFAKEGTDCVAILDWELSTTGHPYADLAGVIMQWQMPTGKHGRGLAGVNRNALGLPSDQDFIAAYCQRRGIKGIPHFGYYLGFCFFRMASILQGVAKRAEDGNASDPEQGKLMGSFVPKFAAAGLQALKG